MIKVGQKVHIRNGEDYEKGVVKYVHPTNRWFSVEHGTDEYKWLTSFKYDDIDRKIIIVKG